MCICTVLTVMVNVKLPVKDGLLQWNHGMDEDGCVCINAFFDQGRVTVWDSFAMTASGFMVFGLWLPAIQVGPPKGLYVG